MDGQAGACCIPRLVFDALLWQHAVDAGCTPLQRTVRDIASSGLAGDFDHVVDARGAHAGTPNAVALRAYWTMPRSVMAMDEAATVQMHTDAMFRRGYGWMFPVQVDGARVRVNLGVGLRADDSVRGSSVTDFYARFVETNDVLRRWRAAANVEKPVGCHVGLGLAVNDVASGGILRIGDAANLADPLTGDGIGNALTSGRLVAEAIDTDADPAAAAAAWQARYDAVFASEFRRALLLQRLLTPTPAKNAGARLLTALPPLRRRVQGAIFGEARYV
jgi:flavin-dependent dehydrogenase